ncbi:unnamed protein product [Miscanthus lutarioriparius]|uniref:Uncharacterized protein n=1 Tax=Miscanthus lutarioriparius TaxID=422564 RepID=A0A811PCI1_9POAL|nr:unnamed protein product [Miscanthus lutarioriparius]
MEIMSPRPPQEFLLDNAAAGAYTPKSAIMNPFASTDDVAAGNPFLATTAVTAPPSPNPFEQLPPGASGADPFDLFQHFTSTPTSPARAAAIYAQFDSVNGGGDKDDDDDVGFQPRVSYSMSKPMVTSTVPFDWEEKPGKPKAEFASVAATTVEAGEMDDADFDFGVLLDKASAQAQELTTADELFDEGKIRPLKPPPRLLESGSVGSSPRSVRSVMWSPRLRARLTGPGSANAKFDPFAAALAKAANAPSPPGAGAKHDAGGVDSASSPMDPDAATPPPSTPPATSNGGGRKKWRLRDLLLFRRATKGRTAGNISKDPVFKYAPVQVQQPVKAASAGPAAADGHASAGKNKKRSKKAAAAEGGMPMPQRQNLMGCVRLHPGLHRLAKGFHGHLEHLGGRGAARSAT